MTTVRLTRDMGVERVRGRAAVDAHFLPMITALMSPAASVRMLKSSDAALLVAGAIATSRLLALEADRHGIPEMDFARIVLAKAGVTNAAIAAIEAQRQAAQAAIDDAPSPVAIDDILRQLR